MKLSVSMMWRVELFCLLVSILPSPTWGECYPKTDERTAAFSACPANRRSSYNITRTRTVPSVTYCGNMCLSDTSCMSFNVLNDTGSSLQCQLSNREISDCSTLHYVVGARSYVMRTSGVCSESWKVALKTDLSSVVNGSLSALREAVLAGADVRVLWEPYPQSDSIYSYKATLYAVDTLKVKDLAPYVTANIYTFNQESMNDSPLWTYIKIDTSGNMEIALSNTTNRTFSSNSFTWLVRTVSSECYQSVVLSHGGPVGKPAYVVENSEVTGTVFDLQSVLARGGTARMVSHYEAAGTLAYPTYFMANPDLLTSLYSISYWIPGEDSRIVLPLRVHEFNFSSVAPIFEAFIEIDTSNGSSYESWAKDPDLSKTEVFVDPCWEMMYSIDESGNEEGSMDALAAALRSGARLLFAWTNGVKHISFVAESIELYNYGFLEASSKMGTTSDNGYKWTPIVGNTNAYLIINGDFRSHSGPRQFYVDRRKRSYRFKMESWSVVEGTWEEASLRLRAGLLPRAIIENSEDPALILEVETAKLAYESYNNVFHSYRLPESDGFRVYMFDLGMYRRDDVGLYKGHGQNVVTSFTAYDSITLIFEDYPLSS